MTSNKCKIQLKPSSSESGDRSGTAFKRNTLGKFNIIFKSICLSHVSRVTNISESMIKASAVRYVVFLQLLRSVPNTARKEHATIGGA